MESTIITVITFEYFMLQRRRKWFGSVAVCSLPSLVIPNSRKNYKLVLKVHLKVDIQTNVNSSIQSRRPNGKPIHLMSSRFYQLEPSVGC